MCLFFIEISFTLGAGEERMSIPNGLKPFEHPHQSMNKQNILKVRRVRTASTKSKPDKGEQ
jgi:hypothetical protein